MRAGEVVELTFRTRNHGAAPSPPGVVTFRLGDGLTPLDALEVPVEPAAAGDDVVARMRVRAPSTCEDRTAVTVRAELAAGEDAFRTNAVRVLVRSRPRLDGAASGTFVDALDGDRVRVRGVVVNEGDGPAGDVHVCVPVPDGCARDDGPDPATARLPRLAPGQRYEVAFDARMVRAEHEVRCDAAEVRSAGGRCVRLPVRSAVRLDAQLAAPAVAVDAGRRRVDVTITVRNDGWAQARDVRVDIAFPPALRLLDGSAHVDGVPCMAAATRKTIATAVGRLERRRGGVSVVLAAVPARGAAVLALALAAPAAGADGAVTARAGERETCVPVATRRTGDVRLTIVGVPHPAAPGGIVAVEAEIVNEGDAGAMLTVGRIDAGGVMQDETQHFVPPCSLVRVAVPVAIASDALDGALLELAVAARDEHGERARASAVLRVRHPVLPYEEEPFDDPAARIDAVLHAPARVCADAAFDVRLELDAPAALERVVVRAPVPSGTRYAGGSCRIDGRALLDRSPHAGDECGFPLAGPGIALGELAQGARVVVTWQLLAPQTDGFPREIAIRAETDIDGEPRDAGSCTVVVEPRAAFAAVPRETPFRLAGCALAPLPPAHAGDGASPATVDAPEPEPRAAPVHDDPHPCPQARTLRFDARRVEAVRRLHRALRGPGLVAHLFALRLFCPDAQQDDPPGDAVGALRAALDDVYDRVYVKLRIPGFDVSADDLDDARLRDAVDALFERSGEPPPYAAGASCGSPAVLRALLRLLDAPCASDERAGDAIAAHARALSGVLERYEGLPLELFDDALARRCDGALDAARAVLLDALAPYLIEEHAAC